MTGDADYSDVDDSSDTELFPFRPVDKAVVDDDDIEWETDLSEGYWKKLNEKDG